MRFNIDNSFWQFITLCTRFAILNILFVITIIPLVTIGPARAALYSTVFAYNDHEDINLAAEYLKRFKREFFRSLGAWLIFVVAIAAVTFAIVFWNSLDTDTAYITLPILIIAGTITLISFEYWFPLQARYSNTFTNTWKNALRLPWAVFGKTLILIAIDVAAAALFAFTTWLRIGCILLGFAWLAYAKSLIYLRIFEQVSGNPNTPREKPDYSLPTASLQ
ncbi:YesL family protein [Bifidobacterium tsurumiense]|uniref:Putative integral membrane protein n=1 Tax=Bifidobacterium tsurumiense TaxID=356829 RepID=A0A087EAV6_9BIFI|nr:YesL family protein [Bifidobacterium tsurumiense]KFJ04907.1 putative integral membrane protein [Bifidobacterium tsurumiense]MDY4678644.1 YesL family protein [Bifidobacterium tsurumiense]MSS13412.1 DUF624 domain-containing protein [Bifidobacterium tsurumiense]